ncbi:MAG: hypothetical protein ACLPXB_09045 [Thiobacillaceae bacterium]
MKGLYHFVAVTFLVAGCGTPSQYGVDSPYYHYPNDVRLILNQSLEIRSDSATVRLQYGHVVAPNGVQEQDPYCIFELSTVAGRPQWVKPDEFKVTDVERSISTIARADLFPMGGALIPVRIGSSGGPSDYYYKTAFYLHSDSQPSVFRMTCQSNQNYTPQKRYLTVAEIRQALGSIFKLSLPS